MKKQTAKPARRANGDSLVTVSSGNVFLDLGFPPGEAAVMALRADLMARLRLLVQTERWTQAEASEHFGIAQSRVSDLLRGKWDKFSLDMLITLAARAGARLNWRWCEVQITLTNPCRSTLIDSNFSTTLIARPHLQNRV